MSFLVSFRPVAAVGVHGSTSVDPALENDYDALVMEACDVLSAAGGSSFHIGGFGSDEWPLDVAYDMSAFMEQLPLLLAGLRENREVAVDLYSQGVERALMFRPVEGRVVIHCVSRTEWVPNPEFENVGQGELVAMLSKLTQNFAKGLKNINSELADVAPFSRWLDGEM